MTFGLAEGIKLFFLLILLAKVEVGFRLHSELSCAEYRLSRALLCILVKYRVASAQQHCDSCPDLVTAAVIVGAVSDYSRSFLKVRSVGNSIKVF